MMKFYPSWFMFLITNLSAFLLILSSDSWFMVWLGFELTLMSFLPMFSMGTLISEALIKYFLVQAGGSSLFALSFLMSFLPMSLVALYMGMFLKLGVFPFYSWVPFIMSGLTWYGCTVLTTIQKLGPLMFISMSSILATKMLIMFSSVSILISGLLAYNQTYLRSLMAYSSVSHTGWLLLAMACSTSLFIIYILTYTLLILLLFSIFSSIKANSIVSSAFKNKHLFSVSLLILTLSGIPPFSVFFLKVNILWSLLEISSIIPLLLLGSMISVYYYLGVVIPSVSNVWWAANNMDYTLHFCSLMVCFMYMTYMVM